MDEFVKQLDKNQDYLSHKMSEKEVIIYVKSNRTEVERPIAARCQPNATAPMNGVFRIFR